jgi:5-dehydro-2-deoxygluconokinase
VTEAPFDLIAIGRVSVDLYPEQIGVALKDVRTFAKSLGGSPTNVAVGAARLGHRTAVVTKVGEDGFGTYVRQALRTFGVDTRWVGTDPDLRTPLVFCEVHPPDHFPLLFYREPRAPDMNIRVEELDLDAIASARIVWTSGTGLSDEPSRSATLAAISRAQGTVIHDLDHRAQLWPSDAEARRWAERAMRGASVVVGNLDEVEMAVGTRDPEGAAEQILRLGPRLAVVKRGGDGAFARTKTELAEAPAVPIEVLCGLGAGDAFGAALCHGLLGGWDLRRTLAFANAAGAIVASRLACADAMPTVEEVEALLARGRAGARAPA